MNMLFDIDKSNRAIVSGDVFDRLRENFSVENPAAKFGRFKGRYMPFRKYIITPTGRFDIGMYFEFTKYIKKNFSDVKIKKTEKFREQLYPRVCRDTSVPKLNLELRDYQHDIVSMCNRVGRGVVVLATAGGKTLTIASLIQSHFENHPKPSEFTCMLMVPDLGLVNQTYADFKQYGVKFSCSKWTGSHDLNMYSNVIICNMGIIQSKKTDLDFLGAVDLLIVDEVHKLRNGNKINNIFKKLNTNNRYGFTGTMPENKEDQWNIIGKIGPILYEKNSYQLREEDYITKAKVYIVKILYNRSDVYSYDVDNFDPTARYRDELKTVQQSMFRNRVISNMCSNMNNNALLLVDYIEHGQLLYNILSTQLDKKVFFIRGDVAVEERAKVQKMMEKDNDIICIAISKIFSTGINIKNLHYIMFCAGGKAKVKIIQSIGRGLRQHESKDMLTIVDIADQLHYGKQHMNKRIKLYDDENFDYKFQTINSNE